MNESFSHPSPDLNLDCREGESDAPVRDKSNVGNLIIIMLKCHVQRLLNVKQKCLACVVRIREVK